MQTSEIPSDITTLLKKGKVFMFSKSYCPYCDRAKSLLEGLKIAFEYVECDDHPLSNSQKDQLTKLTGVTTFPNIFIGTKSIGGCDNLTKLKTKGDLYKLCDEQGVSYEK